MYGGKGNTHMHTYAYTHTHTHTHTYMRTYTHTNIQTYMHTDTALGAAALHPSFVRGRDKSGGKGGVLQWGHLTLLKRDDRRIVNADLVVKRAEEVGFRVGTVDWMYLSLQDQVVK